MRNRFPAPCYRCHQPCAAGDGHFERFAGRWRVQHAECAIKWRGTPDPAREAYNQRRDEARAKTTGRAAQRARKRIRERMKNET